MKKHIECLLGAILLLCDSQVFAGMQEGYEALQRGDYKTAIDEYTVEALTTPDPVAQYNLGLIYSKGAGVPQGAPYISLILTPSLSSVLEISNTRSTLQGIDTSGRSQAFPRSLLSTYQS